jgi:hypothetical protein
MMISLWMEAMVFSLLKENERFAVIASGAKQSISPLAETWIASSLRSSQ